ncbi:MAG TPA: metalloregulator ArsR/SmtB family transcription factor [Thermohalobaculum sp.]|nr:metalloregulator ArsR/SmtB family transcription factor [Thermohalobaculum sp.]
MDRTFAALADPTRRRMVERLMRGEASISELAGPHEMSMPAAMKHVARLVEAGLVSREKRGRSVICRLEPGPMEAASRWLDENLAAWNARLDALDLYLAKQKDQGK